MRGSLFLLVVLFLSFLTLPVVSLPETVELQSNTEIYKPAYSVRYCKLGPPMPLLGRIQPLAVYERSIHCWRVDYNAWGQKLFELHLEATWRYDGYRIVEVFHPDCWTVTYFGWTSGPCSAGWSYVYSTSAKAYATATFYHPLVQPQTRYVYAYVYGDGSGYCGG
ncbi:MAG: hypothetical protein ACP5KE_08320 [Candidatus Methanodesulfokora sp.]